ncbi:MAG: peptidylprolyl isomerase [Bacteroidales bacterium]|nr:peptidylprolyl isomerase [Bacteroidales bacterium]
MLRSTIDAWHSLRAIALVAILGITLAAQAQQNDDPVVVEIAGKPIHKSEFMNEFLRSVGNEVNTTPGVCTFEKREALNNYVELFVNYRTKLADAYALGYDTTKALRKELAGYRAELATPYLIDSATLTRIMDEAYERNHYLLHAAHILVNVTPTASPADTMEAYKTAMNYYNRVMAGEDFMTLAHEATQKRFDADMVDPNDPIRQKNVDDLGCFTVFDMIYPFENWAYGLEPGGISAPGRSKYGYHIVKLFSKTPFFSKATFQHIWISPKKNEGVTEGKCREAWQRINEGESFASICRNYSDDFSSSENGGLVTDISYRQIPPEYSILLTQLKPGQMSEPFKTDLGWHIIIPISHDELAPFEDMVPLYRQRLARDSRNDKPRSAFVEQCKRRYNVVDYTTALTKPTKKKEKPVYMASLDESLRLLDSSVFSKEWRLDESKVIDMRPLLRVDTATYNTIDFLRYIQANMRAISPYSLDLFVYKKYQDFIDQTVYNYANSHLEDENEEFHDLINEYLNGLMIFAYNDEKIWSKAINDTTGYTEFYNRTAESHAFDDDDAANYWWNDRAQVRIVSVADSSLLKPSKAIKLVNKAEKNGWSAAQLRDKLMEKVKIDTLEASKLTVEEVLVEKGNQQLLTSSQWRTGLYERSNGHGYRLIYVEKLIDATRKDKMEARGHYINDYQNYIEQQLLERIKKQYNVKVHQDVIDNIVY